MYYCKLLYLRLFRYSSWSIFVTIRLRKNLENLVFLFCLLLSNLLFVKMEDFFLLDETICALNIFPNEDEWGKNLLTGHDALSNFVLLRMPLKCRVIIKSIRLCWSDGIYSDRVIRYLTQYWFWSLKRIMTSY